MSHNTKSRKSGHSEGKRRQQRLANAQAGNPWPLFESLRSEDSNWILWDDEFQSLLGALEKRAGEAPELFAAELLSQILATAGFLWLRTQLQIQQYIRESDRESRWNQTPHLPPGLQQTLIPRLLEMGRYVGEIAQIQAQTARQWQLARMKHSESSQSKGHQRPHVPHTESNGESPAPTQPADGSSLPGVNGNGPQRLAAMWGES